MILLPFAAEMLDAKNRIHRFYRPCQILPRSHQPPMLPLSQLRSPLMHPFAIECLLVHPDQPSGFSVASLPPLLPDATPVDWYNHNAAFATLLIVIQAIQVLKAFALSISGSTITSTLRHPIHGFTKLKLIHIMDHV